MSGRFFLLGVFLFSTAFPFVSLADSNPSRALLKLASSDEILRWVFGAGSGVRSGVSAGYARDWAGGRLGTHAVTRDNLVRLTATEADQLLAQILSARAAHRVMLEVGESHSKVRPDLLRDFFRFQLVDSHRNFVPMTPSRRLRELGSKMDGSSTYNFSAGELELLERFLRGGSVQLHRNWSAGWELRLRIARNDYVIDPKILHKHPERDILSSFSEGTGGSSFGNRFFVRPDGRAVYYNSGNGIHVLEPRAGSLYTPTREPILRVPVGQKITAFEVARDLDQSALEIVAVVQEDGTHFLRGWIIHEGHIRPHGRVPLVLADPGRGHFKILGVRFTPQRNQTGSRLISLDFEDTQKLATQILTFDGQFTVRTGAPTF